MAYSPDGRWLSVISDDGMVRLLDTQEEQYVHFDLALSSRKLMSSLTDTYAGYFSSLNCVSH